MVVSTSQQVEATETSDIHEELFGLPPGKHQEGFYLDLGVLSEVGKVRLEDQNLAVVDTLGSHKSVAQAADTVHIRSRLDIR